MTTTADQLRAAVQNRPVATKAARGLTTRADLDERVLLALDQTVGGTGLLAIEHTDRYLRVLDHKTFRTESPEEGYEDTLLRALQLADELTPIFTRVAYYYPGVEVVHEGPPVGGGKLMRPESSLLAALAVRMAARAASIRVRPMVYPQEHKKLCAGKRTATKAEVATALAFLIPALEIEGFPSRSNDNLRDALCVAITDLWRAP